LTPLLASADNFTGRRRSYALQPEDDFRLKLYNPVLLGVRKGDPGLGGIYGSRLVCCRAAPVDTMTSAPAIAVSTPARRARLLGATSFPPKFDRRLAAMMQ
jgi:hypothetical protein